MLLFQYAHAVINGRWVLNKKLQYKRLIVLNRETIIPCRIHSRWGGYDFERQVTSVAVIRTKSNIVVFVWGVLARDSDSACLRKLSNLFSINSNCLVRNNVCL